MTSGNWLTQQRWFPAGTCVTWDWSQSHTLLCWLFVLGLSLPFHTTRHSHPAGASFHSGSLTTDTVHGLPTLKRLGRLGRPPCGGSCAGGLPCNTWGEVEQPADVAGRRAEILISSSGYDHRIDLGSSPAQTHSIGPTPTATTPSLPQWGTGGKVGVSPGKPIPKAAQAPLPTPIPGRCHVCSAACGSGPPELPPLLCRLRVPVLATTRGSPSARGPVQAVGAGQRWGAVCC